MMNINILPLLEPISEEEPCGEDYSFSNEFHLIKVARTQDDSLLDQGDWVTERKQADWDLVARTATEVMCKKSKDIRLLTWLTEAWAHQFEYEGIAAGLELSHKLLSQYWLNIHPEIEEDELDQRIGLLQGFINQLPLLIKKVPLINTSPYYHLLDYENFLYHQNNLRKQSEESETHENTVEFEQFEQAIAGSSSDFRAKNYQNFVAVVDHWQILKNILDELMGIDAPSFAAFDSNLDDIQSTLRKIYKVDSVTANTAQLDPVISNVPVILDSAAEPSNSVQNSSHFAPLAQSHLANREQAIKVLEQIADYFQTNEPHSPVSYMLQKTIKWSQMPLHEWLAQVIKEDQSLQMVQETLGVQPKNEYE